LCLGRRLWDCGVRDMAHLASAMSFVVVVAVKVSDSLRAEDKHRHDQR
jgi:hypothetical protein